MNPRRPDIVGAYRRRKRWLKIPPGHTSVEAPSEGGVEEHDVPVTEPPICCSTTPPVVDTELGDRQCGSCGSTWLP